MYSTLDAIKYIHCTEVRFINIYFVVDKINVLPVTTTQDTLVYVSQRDEITFVRNIVTYIHQESILCFKRAYTQLNLEAVKPHASPLL